MEHDEIELMGLKIFASSYTITPPYGKTAFQIEESKMEEIWSGVPEDIDLLITHGPPFGIQDRTLKGINVGSKTIREYLSRTKAKHHFFGHLHECKGEEIFGNVLCCNIAEKIKILEIKKD